MGSDKTIVANLYLPDDIIAEILARLSSVKSLLRFKQLSKWWCSVISSDKFVNAHLENSGKNTTLAHHRAILISSTSQNCGIYVVNDCQVSSLFTEQLIDVDQAVFDYPTAKYNTRILGCCNGLCCIFIGGKEIILWIPSTRKSHKLPTVNVMDTVSILGNKGCIVQVAGFGYDESNNDYKVLATCSCRCSNHLVIRLFSLKTNSWKTIDDFAGTDISHREGVLVNGKIHWSPLFGMYPDRGVKIVSFDLGSEASGFVEPPSAHDHHLELGVIEGCLSVSAFYKHRKIEVWVMKVYGVKETWQKLATLSCSDLKYEFIQPICVSKEGEILFLRRFARSLFIYNPKDKLVRYPKLNILERIHQTGFYFQSLVSPFPDAKQKEHNKN